MKRVGVSPELFTCQRYPSEFKMKIKCHQQTHSKAEFGQKASDFRWNPRLSRRGEVPRKGIVSKVKIQREAVGPCKQSCKNLYGTQQCLGEVKLHIQVVSYLELLSIHSRIRRHYGKPQVY